jgi:hypothetical protein
MSFNSATSGVNSSSVGKAPTPTYGTNTFSSPTGATIATQQYNRPQTQQPVQQPQGKLKVVIKNPKRFLVNKNQNNQEEEQKALSQQPNQTNQENTVKPDVKESLEQPQQQTGQVDPKVLKELEELRQATTRHDRIYALSKIVPFDLFVDKNGKFQQHLWQTEVEKMAERNLPDDVVKELYDLKRKARQQEIAAEIQAQTPTKKTTTARLGASSIAISSQDTAEQDKIVKLLKLINGGL